MTRFNDADAWEAQRDFVAVATLVAHDRSADVQPYLADLDRDELELLAASLAAAFVSAVEAGLAGQNVSVGEWLRAYSAKVEAARAADGR